MLGIYFDGSNSPLKLFTALSVMTILIDIIWFILHGSGGFLTSSPDSSKPGYFIFAMVLTVLSLILKVTANCNLSPLLYLLLPSTSRFLSIEPGDSSWTEEMTEPCTLVWLFDLTHLIAHNLFWTSINCSNYCRLEQSKNWGPSHGRTGSCQRFVPKCTRSLIIAFEYKVHNKE